MGVKGWSLDSERPGAATDWQQSLIFLGLSYDHIGLEKSALSLLIPHPVIVGFVLWGHSAGGEGSFCGLQPMLDNLSIPRGVSCLSPHRLSPNCLPKDCAKTDDLLLLSLTWLPGPGDQVQPRTCFSLSGCQAVHKLMVCRDRRSISAGLMLGYWKRWLDQWQSRIVCPFVEWLR